jgi:hypothetical protein
MESPTKSRAERCPFYNQSKSSLELSAFDVAAGSSEIAAYFMSGRQNVGDLIPLASFPTKPRIRPHP